MFFALLSRLSNHLWDGLQERPFAGVLAVRLSIAVALILAVAAHPTSSPIAAASAGRLTAREARQHIGQQATICGRVASVTYAPHVRRQPTFLNLEEPYPKHIFTIVIWGTNRAAFSPPPESAYREKHICVTGRIREYRGFPEVFVTSPADITIEP